VDVFLVPERRMVGQLARLPVQTNALNFWRTRVVVEWVTAWFGVGPHEFVHVLSSDRRGEAREWWLGEGAAVAAGPWRGINVHKYAKCLGDAGRLYSIETLVATRSRELDPEVTYPQAGSFARFLIDQYGADRFWHVYTRGAAAVPEVYGHSVAELGAEWRRTLGAVDAAGIPTGLGRRLRSCCGTPISTTARFAGTRWYAGNTGREAPCSSYGSSSATIPRGSATSTWGATLAPSSERRSPTRS
jgi:hypothetical protein